MPSRTLVTLTLLAGLSAQAAGVPAAPASSGPDPREPAWPDPSWAVSSPAAEGIDPGPIEALSDAIAEGRYGLVDRFLLIRHGRVVHDRRFEHDYEAIAAARDPADHQYDYDHPRWHPYYRGTELHTLQSVTKSVTSVVLGIAIDEGHLPDGVRTPAMGFFEPYGPDLTDPRRRAMTIEDLLTMRSGLDWNEMISPEDPANSCVQLEASDAWIRFVLDRPMREDPGTRFDYNSGASVLLGKVVRVATGRRIDEYAREKLFEPLGIEEHYWKVTPDGEVDTEGGLYLASEDLARIAYLLLRKGEWNGRRIVSEAWVSASVKPHVADVDPGDGRRDTGYGYQWWVPEHADGAPIVYQGRGYGGQLPTVVPHLDLVVVFNAWNIHERPARSTWAAVRDIIIPAVRPPGEGPRVVEASCGQCQFGLPGRGCDLAVRIDGRAWFVDGTGIDDHGDAHADDGFCNAVRRARVTGRVERDRFVATSFELLADGPP